MNVKKLLVLVISIITFSAVSLNAAKEDYTYHFKDVDSNEIVLHTFVQGIHFDNAKGKVVLLDFFGNVCPPCLMEIPELIELQKEFKNDFKIIAFQVQTQIDNKSLKEFVKSHNINYTVINNSDPNVFVFTDYISAKTSWKGMIPFAILFDKNGNAVKVYLGMKSKQEFEQDIKSLLK